MTKEQLNKLKSEHAPAWKALVNQTATLTGCSPAEAEVDLADMDVEFFPELVVFDPAESSARMTWDPSKQTWMLDGQPI